VLIVILIVDLKPELLIIVGKNFNYKEAINGWVIKNLFKMKF
jgi:hypothetical protein